MNHARRKNRHQRLRSRLHGTAQRPRVSVFRSAKSLTLQFIDDQTGTTLLTMQTEAAPKLTKVQEAAVLGKQAAAAAGKKKITQVVFDRGGYTYHGRVKAVADGLREGGLNF